VSNSEPDFPITQVPESGGVEVYQAPIVETRSASKSVFDPLRITVKAPLDFGGMTPQLAASDLREKAVSSAMKSLDIDPNNTELRKVVHSIDPNAKLPAERPCFVATASSYDRHSFEVRTLSAFRDRFLVKSSLGAYFVGQYYKYGSYAARPIALSMPLRISTRMALQPAVAWAWLCLHPLFLFLQMLLGAFAALSTGGRTQCPESN
jgi:hypothetical protein